MAFNYLLHGPAYRRISAESREPVDHQKSVPWEGLIEGISAIPGATFTGPIHYQLQFIYQLGSCVIYKRLGPQRQVPGKNISQRKNLLGTVQASSGWPHASSGLSVSFLVTAGSSWSLFAFCFPCYATGAWVLIVLKADGNKMAR